MIAKDSEVTKFYLTSSGVVVRVISKNDSKVVVRSDKTGNIIELPHDYQFREEIKLEETAMTENTTSAVEAPTTVNKEKRGKKSVLIDEALKAQLSTDDITKKVLEVYPSFPERNLRNLISVRRSKLKKLLK